MRIYLLILASFLAALLTLPGLAVSSAPRRPLSSREPQHSRSVPAAAVATTESHTGVATSSRWPLILAGIYCVAVVLASLAGGWLPLVVRPTHTRLQLSMSFCGGLMLGIGLLHMLPHSVAALGSLDHAVYWMMAGLLTMFLLIRAFHFHQHEPAPALGADPARRLRQPATSTSPVITSPVISIRTGVIESGPDG